jgi:hypothetical protein
MSRTTIALEDSTKAQLCALKRGGESYDDLLLYILDSINRDSSGEVTLD